MGTGARRPGQGPEAGTDTDPVPRTGTGAGTNAGGADGGEAPERQAGHGRQAQFAGDLSARDASTDDRGGESGAADRADAGVHGTPTPAGGQELSDRDRAVLALARRTWTRPGAKERAIREQLGMSPTRYHQLLNALLDTPAALAHDPVTVNRLRRVRDARRRRR